MGNDKRPYQIIFVLRSTNSSLGNLEVQSNYIVDSMVP